MPGAYNPFILDEDFKKDEEDQLKTHISELKKSSLPAPKIPPTPSMDVPPPPMTAFSFAAPPPPMATAPPVPDIPPVEEISPPPEEPMSTTSPADDLRMHIEQQRAASDELAPPMEPSVAPGEGASVGGSFGPSEEKVEPGIGTSLKQGIGNTLTQVGGALQFGGERAIDAMKNPITRIGAENPVMQALGAAEKLGIGGKIKETGKDIVAANPVPVREDVDLLDPTWWRDAVVPQLPTTAAFIGMAAATGGAGVLPTAVLSRVVESSMEAAQAEEESKRRGMGDDDAKSAANQVFLENLALTGADALQVALAFSKAPAPLKKAISGAMSNSWGKAGITAARFLGAAGSEGMEEVIQDFIQQRAQGDELHVDPRTFAVGAATGAVFNAGPAIVQGAVDFHNKNMEAAFDRKLGIVPPEMSSSETNPEDLARLEAATAAPEEVSPPEDVPPSGVEHKPGLGTLDQSYERGKANLRKMWAGNDEEYYRHFEGPAGMAQVLLDAGYTPAESTTWDDIKDPELRKLATLTGSLQDTFGISLSGSPTYENARKSMSAAMRKAGTEPRYSRPIDYSSLMGGAVTDRKIVETVERLLAEGEEGRSPPKGSLTDQLSREVVQAMALRNRAAIMRALEPEAPEIAAWNAEADAIEGRHGSLRGRLTKTGEEARARIAERPLVRARTAQPVETLKPSQKAWAGNLFDEGSRYAADGHSIVDLQSVTGSTKLLAKKSTRNILSVDQSDNLGGKMLSEIAASSTVPGRVVGFVDGETNDGGMTSDFRPALLDTNDGVDRWVDANKVRLIQHVTKYDEVRAQPNPKDAVTFFRKGQPVAVLMPLNNVENIDTTEMRRTLGITPAPAVEEITNEVQDNAQEVRPEGTSEVPAEGQVDAALDVRDGNVDAVQDANDAQEQVGVVDAQAAESSAAMNALRRRVASPDTTQVDDVKSLRKAIREAGKATSYSDEVATSLGDIQDRIDDASNNELITPEQYRSLLDSLDKVENKLLKKSADEPFNAPEVTKPATQETTPESETEAKAESATTGSPKVGDVIEFNNPNSFNEVVEASTGQPTPMPKVRGEVIRLQPNPIPGMETDVVPIVRDEHGRERAATTYAESGRIVTTQEVPSAREESPAQESAPTATLDEVAAEHVRRYAGRPSAQTLRGYADFTHPEVVRNASDVQLQAAVNRAMGIPTEETATPEDVALDAAPIDLPDPRKFIRRIKTVKTHDGLVKILEDMDKIDFSDDVRAALKSDLRAKRLEIDAALGIEEKPPRPTDPLKDQGRHPVWSDLLSAEASADAAANIKPLTPVSGVRGRALAEESPVAPPSPKVQKVADRGGGPPIPPTDERSGAGDPEENARKRGESVLESVARARETKDTSHLDKLRSASGYFMRRFYDRFYDLRYLDRMAGLGENWGTHATAQRMSGMIAKGQNILRWHVMPLLETLNKEEMGSLHDMWILLDRKDRLAANPLASVPGGTGGGTPDNGLAALRAKVGDETYTKIEKLLKDTKEKDGRSGLLELNEQYVLLPYLRSGIINKSTYNKIRRDHPHYLPGQREMYTLDTPEHMLPATERADIAGAVLKARDEVGSEAALDEPVARWMSNFISAQVYSSRNQAGREIVTALQEWDEIDMSKTNEGYQPRDIRGMQERLGRGDLPGSEFKTRQVTIRTETPTQRDSRLAGTLQEKGDTISFYVDGVRFNATVPEVYATMAKGLEAESAHWLIRWGSILSSPLRAGATALSLTFAPRNLVRDAQSMYVREGFSINSPYYWRGLESALKVNLFGQHSTDFDAAAMAGVLSSGIVEIGSGIHTRDYVKEARDVTSTSRQILNEIDTNKLRGITMSNPEEAILQMAALVAAASKTTGSAMSVAGLPFKGMLAVNTVLEQAPRIATYLKVRDELFAKRNARIQELVASGTARPDADVQAANELPDERIDLEAAVRGRDVTVDFAKAGTIIRTLNMITPFLNARIQGTSNTIRSAQNNPKRFMIGTVVPAAAITMALFALNSQWDSWDLIPDHEWDKNWIIIVGEEEQNVDPVHPGAQNRKYPVVLRIPKGEAAAIVTAPFEAIMRMMAKKNDRGWADHIFGMAKTMVDSATPLPAPREGLLSWRGAFYAAQSVVVPPIGQTLMSAASGKDPYLGRDIIPVGEQKRLPIDQYDATTHKSIVAIARAFGMSPRLLEWGVKTYTADIGDQVMWLLDLGLGAAGYVANTDLVEKPIGSKNQREQTATEFASRLPGVRGFLGVRNTEEDRIGYEKLQKEHQHVLEELYKIPVMREIGVTVGEAPPSITLGSGTGVKIDLKPAERAEYQRLSWEKTKPMLDKLEGNQAFASAPVSVQRRVIDKLMDAGRDIAKAEVARQIDKEELKRRLVLSIQAMSR